MIGQLARMAEPQDSLQVRLLRAIEELLNNRRPDTREVDTNMVLERMRLEGEKARDELAQAMSEYSLKATCEASS